MEAVQMFSEESNFDEKLGSIIAHLNASHDQSIFLDFIAETDFRWNSSRTRI